MKKYFRFDRFCRVNLFVKFWAASFHLNFRPFNCYCEENTYYCSVFASSLVVAMDILFQNNQEFLSNPFNITPRWFLKAAYSKPLFTLHVSEYILLWLNFKLRIERTNIFPVNAWKNDNHTCRYKNVAVAYGRVESNRTFENRDSFLKGK